MSSLSDFLEIGRVTRLERAHNGQKSQEMVVLVNRCQEAGGKARL